MRRDEAKSERHPLKAAPAKSAAERPARVREEKWEKASASVPIFMPRRDGARPEGRAPVILETSGEVGYRLLDMGSGLKLEQYGDIRIVRPEAQALWPSALPDSEWDAADAVFTGDTEEDGAGRWRFPHAALGENWPMRLLDV